MLNSKEIEELVKSSFEKVSEKNGQYLYDVLLYNVKQRINENSLIVDNVKLEELILNASVEITACTNIFTEYFTIQVTKDLLRALRKDLKSQL